MGVYYTFYRPQDMKMIKEGKFAGMPFFFTNLKPEPIIFPDDATPYHIGDCYTGIMNREMAIAYQEQMESNQTLFTDLMDENNTDCLIYRIT